MAFHGNSAAQRAHALAMTNHDHHRDGEESTEELFGHEPESPSLAGYIVYIIAVLGFMTMCVSNALH